jgi:DNA-binding LacI/PurR family transcriptional regulator
VLDAAIRLGYIYPREQAASRKIGCVLSYTADKYSDKYFTGILAAADKALAGTGCALSSFFNLGELLKSEDKIKSEGFAGFILFDDSLSEEKIAWMQTLARCVVGVDTDYPGIDNVGHNHYRTGLLAMEHLIRRGHERIAYIGGDDRSLHGRESSYLDYMKQRNLTVPPDYILDCSWEPERCYEMTARLCARRDRPTAIFAGSDNLAIAVLSAIHAHGLSVPGDIAVVGVNNLDFSAFTSPPLTTVSIPVEEIGKTAIELLLRRINGFRGLPMSVFFPTTLIVRESA